MGQLRGSWGILACLAGRGRDLGNNLGHFRPVRVNITNGHGHRVDARELSPSHSNDLTSLSMMTSHLPITTFTFNDLPLTTYPLPLKQGTALFPPYIAPFHPTFLSINIKIYPPTKPLFHVLKNLKIIIISYTHLAQFNDCQSI